jgi:heavy metal sensor kinase
MTLAGRLSAFFLAALALILAAFSATLYLGAWYYLDRQLDEHLDAALAALAAAVEFEDGYVEWEPGQRPFRSGRAADGDAVRWAVRDDRARVVDQELGPDDGAGAVPQGGPLLEEMEWAGRSWRSRSLAVQARGRTDRPLPDNQYPELVLTAAVPVGPMQASLAALAAALLVGSAAVWLGAALLGRGLCRRALAPLTRMADAARATGAADRARRLPVPATQDDLRDLADAFNGLLARLQENYERQARFTGDAAHQLRTPLAALLGQIDVALLRERPAEEYRRSLETMHDQADGLRQIVESLLYLARADAEVRDPDLRPLDLVPWLRDHLKRWSSHPRAGDLRVKLGEGPLSAATHGALLGQLLDNLLDNAWKYSPPGTPTTIRLAVDGDRATLSVEDAGRGVAPEDVPHIFEPFYRSKQARAGESPGVGLGLAVAARIATALGGTLTAASEPDRGSRFEIRLPLAAASGAPAASHCETGALL